MSAAEAVAERDRILSEVEIARRRAIDAGLEIIRRWAATGHPFSANDCRAELRAVGVQSASTGALFNAAIKAHIVRKVGYETSTDIGTHAKPVARYVAASARVGLEVLTVPVQRDRGRFTRTTSEPAPDALFDITEGAHG